MKIIIFTIICFNALFSEIINYKSKILDNELSIKLILDSNKERKIDILHNKRTQIISIKDITKNKTIKIRNNFIKNIILVPSNNNTYIHIENNTSMNIYYSQNKNIIDIKIKKSTLKALNFKNSNSKVVLKKDSISNNNYLISFSIILVTLIIYWVFKRNLIKNNIKLNNNFSIKSQKAIDTKSKIVNFSYDNKEYLVLINPNSTILLDKKSSEINQEEENIAFNEIVKSYESK